MEFVFFGLSVSSSWGNGHATLLRGLFRALHSNGHTVHFFEKDAPYYASHRDASEFPFVRLYLYREFSDIVRLARELLARVDVAVVTSYCADGAIASDLVLTSRAGCKLFYDMDTPVTLLRLEQGEPIPYLPESGLRDFDMVLSYTGGTALTRLRNELGARHVETLYGWVDPDVYRPAMADSRYAGDFSYLGTYSPDRQEALRTLFLKPAAALPARNFVVGGAMYADAACWPANVRYFEHVGPEHHCAFYSSSPITLNITRGAMATMGFCPSGRLFEAAACGTAVLSDWWAGLDEFFEPGKDILIARSSDDVTNILDGETADLARIGQNARVRALDCHTADIRARRLVELIERSSQASAMAECTAAQGA